jgi:hypothetical protein
MKANRSIAGLTALAFAVSVTGCATKGADIAASYVPASIYEGASCKQLAADIVEVQGKVIELTAKQDTAAGNDTALVVVSAILFWPAIFFVGGKGAQEAELARLKGSAETMNKTYKAKNCEVAS